MNNAKACRTVAAMLATGAMCATMAVAPFSPMVERVEAANTYSKLLNAQNKKAASAQREAQLRSQLAGVKSDLADKIVELDELTNTKIPAAQAAKIDKKDDGAPNFFFTHRASLDIIEKWFFFEATDDVIPETDMTGGFFNGL